MSPGSRGAPLGGALLLLAVVLGGAARGQERKPEKLEEGKPAPEIDVGIWTNSKAVKLADLKGKVVLLDFWGVWCPPCVKAVPLMKALHEKYKEKDLAILAIHTKNSADKLPALVEKEGVKYPICVDENGATVKKYKVTGFPTYVLVDKKGVVRGIGYTVPKTDDIDALLNEK